MTSPTIRDLRARLAAAQAAHEAARERYEAWVVPPMEPDATLEDYRAYDEARQADFDTWLRAEDAWRELDAWLHPRRYPDGAWPRAGLPGTNLRGHRIRERIATVCMRIAGHRAR